MRDTPDLLFSFFSDFELEFFICITHFNLVN